MTAPDAPIVLQFRRPILCIALPLLAVLLTGMVWAVVDAVVHRDAAYPWRDSGLGPTGRTVGWCVLGAMIVVLAVGAVVMVRLRFVLGPDGATGRVFRAEHTFTVDGLTRVRILRARRGGYVPQAARLRVTGRDEHGRLRRFVLNQSFTGLALPVVAGWVRRRPELVKPGDDVTAAVFAAPRTHPTAPPIGGFRTTTGGHWLPPG